MARKSVAAILAISAALIACLSLLGQGHRYGGQRFGDGAVVAPVISAKFGANAATPHPGDTFTSSNGTWTNTPVSYTYQWEDCDGAGDNCQNIDGATTNSYTVQDSDLGNTLRIVVQACNIFGCAGVAPGNTSDATGLVANVGTAPINAVPPAVSGVPTIGTSLTSTTGTWSGTPTGYTYQWQRCDLAGNNCANISSATASSHTVVSGDTNFTLRVGVIATNGSGSSSTVYSTVTSPVGSATFGKTTIGSTCAAIPADKKSVNVYTLSGSATLTGFFAYLQPSGLTNQQQRVEGVVYSDSGGSPGSLLAVSQPITITSNSAAQWYSFNFPATSAPVGNYWIGLLSGQNSGVAADCYDTGSNLYTNNNSFLSGPSSTFGSFTLTSQALSAYVTYTLTGSNPVPSTPTGLAAVSGDTTVQLSWNAATCSSCTISGYQVFRNGSRIGTTTTTDFADSGLTNNTTYSYTVAAFDTAGVVGAQSAAVQTTPQASGGGGGGGTSTHVVPSIPDLPGALVPSSGWTVQYADAFGSCFVSTLTQCSGNYPRADSSWAPNNNTGTSIHCSNNSTEMPSCQPQFDDVGSNGYDGQCRVFKTSSANYGCGRMGGGYGTSNAFNWHWSDTNTYAIQFEVKMPPNEGNMDPQVWSQGPGDQPEVDFPEIWGYGSGCNWTSTANTWNGCNGTYPGIPSGHNSCTGCNSSTSVGGLHYTGSGSSPLAKDPSSGFETYTLYFGPNDKQTAYINGVQVTSTNFKINTTPWIYFIMGNDMRLNANNARNPDPNFPAAGNDFYMHYIAFYVPTAQGTSGIQHQQIVPGTTCAPVSCGASSGGGGGGGTTTTSTTTTSTTTSTGTSNIVFDGTFSPTDPTQGPNWHNAFGNCYSYTAFNELTFNITSSCNPGNNGHYRTDVCSGGPSGCSATSGVEPYVKGTAYCTSVPVDLVTPISNQSGNSWIQVAEMKDSPSVAGDWTMGFAQGGVAQFTIGFTGGAYNNTPAWNGPATTTGWHTFSICQNGAGTSATAWFDGVQKTFNVGSCSGQTTCTGLNMYYDGQPKQPLDINGYSGNTSGSDPWVPFTLIHGDPLVASNTTTPPEQPGGWNSP